MANDFFWDPSALVAAARAEAMRRLVVAGNSVKEVAITNIDFQGQRNDHSAPGEFPYKQSGDLQRFLEVVPEPEDTAVKVGSPIEYAIMLENGTADMAARPWLVPSLESRTAEIRRIMNS